jgi:NAD(P)-dependent dehydrogenase (short-subunit alcohol dehydrogenase family)
MSLDQRVYTVSGGASGIGRALALALAREGAFVYISDTNQTGLDETEKQSRLQLNLLTCQVRDWRERS